MKRKLIDENGKFFGLVSLIDIAVVLVCVVLAFAVYARFFTTDTTSAVVENSPFYFTLRLNGVRSQSMEAIKVGDVLYETENSAYLGKVTGVSMVPHMANVLMDDGTYVTVEEENRYDIIIDVESSGLISNGRFYANRTYEIGANASVAFYTKYLSSSGVIWSVSETKD